MTLVKLSDLEKAQIDWKQNFKVSLLSQNDIEFKLDQAPTIPVFEVKFVEQTRLEFNMNLRPEINKI
jgi:hypothetical protein